MDKKLHNLHPPSHRTLPPTLERFQKYCSHAVRPTGSGLFDFWLRFRSVTGHCGHAPSLKSRMRDQKPKILAPHGHTIFENALKLRRNKMARQDIELRTSNGKDKELNTCMENTVIYASN